jgi:hypothetical protein
MIEDRLPTPPQIADAPELAIIALLEITLEVTGAALAAAHPELSDEDFPLNASEEARWADRIMLRADRVQHALAHYRYALRLSQEDAFREREDTDPPF